MIPVKDRLIDVDSLPGEELQFGIGDPRWVMKTQADLYSDITTAIIREYSTNAYDAHVMAGNPDPINVTLPTEMNPYFVVEDKGVGMNRDTFKEVYIQFGVSNKRDNNSVNGMLGYGSKSGVAYTTQFSVTSVKDGVKTYGIVKRKPDWAIVLKVVSQSHTDEPNGTRIEIPVHNIDEFRAKAKDFYRFWLPGRVLVDGAEPEHFAEEKIAEGFFRSPSNSSYVVMGNVPYRVHNSNTLFYNLRISSFDFVAYLDSVETENGQEAAFEFTPSREDLKYTEHTKKSLHSVAEKMEKYVLEASAKEIAAASSHSEAFLLWRKWSALVGNGALSDLTYKGDKFALYTSVDGHIFPKATFNGGGWHVDRFHTADSPNMMFVTDYHLSGAHSETKRKCRAYADMKGWTNVKTILVTHLSAKDIVSPWIPRDRFVTHEDLKRDAPKRPRSISGGGTRSSQLRVKGSWDYFDKIGLSTQKAIPSQGEIYYATSQHCKDVAMSSALRALDSDAVVIKVPKNRLAKFVRENPNIKNVDVLFQDKVITDPKVLFRDDWKETESLFLHTQGDLPFLKSIGSDWISSQVARLEKFEKELEFVEKNRALARALGNRDVPLKPGGLLASSNCFEDRYPLLTRRMFQNKEHVKLYVHAVDAFLLEKENNK